MRRDSVFLRRVAHGSLVLVLAAGMSSVVPSASAGTLAASAPGHSAAPALRTADSGARITGEKWIDDTTVDLAVESPSVGATEMVRVLVPKGWSRGAARTWPVVYAYQGGNDDYTSWVRGSQIVGLAAKWDVMVVMPSGGKNGGFADWWNYGQRGTPKWETFHMAEVMQLLERNYRAGTNRAALGVSSGGQGAIAYAARHPGTFRYAASFSGILHLTKPGLPWVLMIQGIPFDFDPFRVWGVPGWDDKNWKSYDPYELAERLRGTGLYISSGTTGLPGPYDKPLETPLQRNFLGAVGELIVGSTTTDFVARLQQLGIPATTNVYGDGWHNWNYWKPELDKAWPLMMDAVGAGRV
ncbi:alpha/beta hydrolase family protein [Spirillospora sp. NPDC047279]|uniref:alpha/beta hydrolase n=1 Tax=Spirillospora sp. NPDC047279 TaxID=3155478 RepID=UPI0033D7BF98